MFSDLGLVCFEAYHDAALTQIYFVFRAGTIIFPRSLFEVHLFELMTFQTFLSLSFQSEWLCLNCQTKRANQLDDTASPKQPAPAPSSIPAPADVDSKPVVVDSAAAADQTLPAPETKVATPAPPLHDRHEPPHSVAVSDQSLTVCEPVAHSQDISARTVAETQERQQESPGVIAQGIPAIEQLQQSSSKDTNPATVLPTDEDLVLTDTVGEAIPEKPFVEEVLENPCEVLSPDTGFDEVSVEVGQNRTESIPPLTESNSNLRPSEPASVAHSDSAVESLATKEIGCEFVDSTEAPTQSLTTDSTLNTNNTPKSEAGSATTEQIAEAGTNQKDASHPSVEVSENVLSETDRPNERDKMRHSEIQSNASECTEPILTPVAHQPDCQADGLEQKLVENAQETNALPFSSNDSAVEKTLNSSFDREASAKGREEHSAELGKPKEAPEVTRVKERAIENKEADVEIKCDGAAFEEGALHEKKVSEVKAETVNLIEEQQNQEAKEQKPLSEAELASEQCSIETENICAVDKKESENAEKTLGVGHGVVMPQQTDPGTNDKPPPVHESRVQTASPPEDLTATEQALVESASVIPKGELQPPTEILSPEHASDNEQEKVKTREPSQNQVSDKTSEATESDSHLTGSQAQPLDKFNPEKVTNSETEANKNGASSLPDAGNIQESIFISEVSVVGANDAAAEFDAGTKSTSPNDNAQSKGENANLSRLAASAPVAEPQIPRAVVCEQTTDMNKDASRMEKREAPPVPPVKPWDEDPRPEVTVA